MSFRFKRKRDGFAQCTGVPWVAGTRAKSAECCGSQHGEQPHCMCLTDATLQIEDGDNARLAVRLDEHAAAS